MAENSATVLGGILPNRKDLLAVAVLQLNPELFFANEIHRNIFIFLHRYYDRADGVMPEGTFVAALEASGVETTKALAYSQAFKQLVELPVTEPEFRWALGEMHNEYAKKQTGFIITNSMEILERGFEVDRQVYKGHEAARHYLMSEIHKLDRLSNIEAAPEGNIFSEADSIMQQYLNRKNATTPPGILTGIPSIDNQVGGFQPGELSLVCAYTNQGKSQFVTQTAWDATVRQGKNVLFATSETVRDTVIRRCLARHSRLPQFGYPRGLDSSAIKKGTLTREEEQIFRAVLDDWTNNPAYGTLNAIQIPKDATLDYVEQRAKAQARDIGLDLVIDDYLALLSPYVRRNNEREEFNEILRNSKLMAVTLKNGEGVPVISPWAMKQDAFKEALRTQRYGLAALSDTSEAEKSPDQIIALLRDPEVITEIRFQFLKLRDEGIPPIKTLEIDFRCSYLGDSQGASAFGLADGGTNPTTHDDLMALTQ